MPVAKVRIVAKAKNAILAKLADDCGGCKQAAELLGVNPTSFSQWLNFRVEPCLSGKGAFTLDRRRDLIFRLEQATGRSIREIFPGLTKSQLHVLAKPRTVERDVDTHSLADCRDAVQLLAAPSTELDAVEHKEVSQLIGESLRFVSPRERAIVKMISAGYTFKEVAEIFKISQGRTQQIYQKALRTLRKPAVAGGLLAYCD